MSLLKRDYKLNDGEGGLSVNSFYLRKTHRQFYINREPFSEVVRVFVEISNETIGHGGFVDIKIGDIWRLINFCRTIKKQFTKMEEELKSSTWKKYTHEKIEVGFYEV